MTVKIDDLPFTKNISMDDILNIVDICQKKLIDMIDNRFFDKNARTVTYCIKHIEKYHYMHIEQNILKNGSCENSAARLYFEEDGNHYEAIYDYSMGFFVLNHLYSDDDSY